MYLRETRQKRVDGTVITHLQLAESVWNPAKRRSDTRIVHNCGRAEDPTVGERLRRLARSILRRCSPEEIVAADPSWKVVDAWPYGDLFVLEQLWRRLGIAEVIEAEAKGRKFAFSMERALFALVANRALAPCSKLYCFEQWLREDVRIEGAEHLELQRFYQNFVRPHRGLKLGTVTRTPAMQAGLATRALTFREIFLVAMVVAFLELRSLSASDRTVAETRRRMAA